MEEMNPLKNHIKYQEKVLDTMKNYESLLRDLYAIYAEKFPEQGDFWRQISKEEQSHAYWLETLANQIGNKQVYFNEERFGVPPLEGCIDEAITRIEQAKNEPMELLEAVSISIGIESGMIERNFFEVFESDSAEIKNTFNMLRTATMEHRKLVKIMWETERLRTEKKKPNLWERLKGFFVE